MDSRWRGIQGPPAVVAQQHGADRARVPQGVPVGEVDVLVGLHALEHDRHVGRVLLQPRQRRLPREVRGRPREQRPAHAPGLALLLGPGGGVVHLARGGRAPARLEALPLVHLPLPGHGRVEREHHELEDLAQPPDPRQHGLALAPVRLHVQLPPEHLAAAPLRGAGAGAPRDLLGRHGRVVADDLAGAEEARGPGDAGLAVRVREPRHGGGADEDGGAHAELAEEAGAGVAPHAVDEDARPEEDVAVDGVVVGLAEEVVGCGVVVGLALCRDELLGDLGYLVEVEEVV